MKNVSHHVPYTDCCGCGACANTCSKGAIQMKENHEGFLVPHVDEAACIDCGLCLKACPALQEKRANEEKPDCYAAQAEDNIRSVSSSGGVFTPLAEAIINRGGYVCGAAFREDWTVHHIIIDNKDDLAKLRGSKYVQSDTEDCFKRIKALLRDGKWVLFSGTPCQVAGLYTYLGKEYDTLVTVDIFCHGAPSPGVWKRYLNENYKLEDIAKINFRDKTAIGWSCSHVAITLKNGKKDVSNEYTRWFHTSIILRPSCQDCKFSKIPRPADITLGDWWGISEYKPGMNDGTGLSNVLINSVKGRELYASLNLKLSEQIELKPSYGNGHLYHGLKLNEERTHFFNSNIPLNIFKREEAAIKDKMYDICYVSIFYGCNYGSILVSYAGYKLLEDLGLSVLVLNRPKCIWPQPVPVVKDSIQHAFAHRHYANISPQYNGYADLAITNNYCRGYVVGGDQLFNPHLHIDILSFIPFARNKKLKVCFSTSFGNDSYKVQDERLLKNKAFLQRFDKIALRETPEHLVENVFDVKADEVIDSTLIASNKYFHELADSATQLEIEKPYLLTYTLDLNPEKEDVIVHIAKKLGLKIICIRNLQSRDRHYNPTKFSADRDYSPEEFCKLYKNASFVVTDSYHGSCFSIIFKKQFVSIVNIVRGRVRYAMFDSFGLTNCFYASPDEVYKTDDWMNPIDYKYVEKIINKKAKYARRWLAKALRRVIWERRIQNICDFRKNLSKAIAVPVRNFFRKLRGKK